MEVESCGHFSARGSFTMLTSDADVALGAGGEALDASANHASVAAAEIEGAA